MLQLKLCLLNTIFLLICVVKVCEPAGNYSIGFERYGGNHNRPSPTKPPRPNPTYRPSSSSHRPNPTYRPSSSSYRPNPTYRPSSPRPSPTYRPSSSSHRPNPTYRPSSPRPNPTYRPSSSSHRPNPTYRPSAPNPTYRPSPPNPNPTYWPPKTNPAPPKTTPRPVTRKTTPKPTPQPKPTSPPLWNIWSSNQVNKESSPFLKAAPANNFKQDPTLLGLYTLMRNVVGVTLSQTGQTKPAKKPLHESYPYYYAVYHYNKDREKVASKISVPYESVGYCDAGTSDRTCVPGTYALCLLDWSIMCVTYSTATFPCHFNMSLQCALGKVPCDTRDPICASVGSQIDVQTPCISNVVITSSSAILGSITQTSAPDPYANIVPGPIELCATTILEMKKLESPVGAFVGFLSELEKAHLDFLNNFNATQYLQPSTTFPPFSPGTGLNNYNATQYLQPGTTFPPFSPDTVRP